MTATIDQLLVDGDVGPWTALGLVAEPAGEGSPPGHRRIPLVGTGVEITGRGDGGMAGWVMSGVDAAIADVDGVPTVVRPPEPPRFAEHSLDVLGIDHVVVATDDLERTCGAITRATGAQLRRVREAGEVRQGFHRVGAGSGSGGGSVGGGLIVEVVERSGTPAGPAVLWGFVLAVADLDTACADLGDELISEPRTAVQPGRTIATLRPAAGLGVAVALMSPHV